MDARICDNCKKVIPVEDHQLTRRYFKVDTQIDQPSGRTEDVLEHIDWCIRCTAIKCTTVIDNYIQEKFGEND